MKRIFNWFSKHATLLIWAGGAVVFILFTFVWPVLLAWVRVPVWLLLIIIAFPFAVWRAWVHFFVERKTRRFKGGEWVIPKVGGVYFHILGYTFLSNRLVRCSDKQGNVVIYHETALNSVYDQ